MPYIDVTIVVGPPILDTCSLWELRGSLVRAQERTAHHQRLTEHELTKPGGCNPTGQGLSARVPDPRLPRVLVVADIDDLDNSLVDPHYLTLLHWVEVLLLGGVNTVLLRAVNTVLLGGVSTVLLGLGGVNTVLLGRLRVLGHSLNAEQPQRSSHASALETSELLPRPC